MTRPNSTIWWPDYQQRLRFLDGGRSDDLVDCYGMCRLIYQEQLAITLALWPQLSLDAVTASGQSLVDAPFTTPFTAIEQGLEQGFDMAVIRRPLPVNGVMKRGWWHLGVVTRPGFILHIDYHAGVVEEPFRATLLSACSATLRARDVRLFRHHDLHAPAVELEAVA
jgi:hypothetical protein